MTGLPDVRLVEAALFSAGKPLELAEIAAASGLPEARAKDALRKLEGELSGEHTALAVTKAGAKWVMQLKAAYVEHARTLAPREIPGKLLKTLALIAFHQPMKQSDLVKMIGPKTYDHVPELHERGLVTVREAGITKLLATSPTFPEYFGIPAEAKEDIRTFLAEKVGLALQPAESPPGEAAPAKEPARQEATAPA